MQINLCHTLTPFDMPDNFGQQGGDGEDGEAGEGFRIDWDRVGDDDFVESGLRQVFDGFAGEDGVSGRGVDILQGAALDQCFLGSGKRAGCVDQVIENYAAAAFYLADDFQYFGLMVSGAMFVHYRQIGFELNAPEPGATEQRSMWRTYYLERTVRLTGTSISNAVPSYDPNTNQPIVLLDFNRFGSRVFGDVTAEIVGRKLATILDDKVKSAPIINGAIRGGRASITMGGGEARRQEAERNELVNVLKTGSLPAPLKEESASEIGPTLGMDAIAKTRLSFGLGVLLVFGIMLGIYKWSGLIAVFCVIYHILLTITVMAMFGATLTLPGIAAVVLSVGMTVDGNILIYERIRDELLLGKSVRGAIDLGFSRAFSAILDGQLTTAAAGWVLLQYGSGPIKGFAVMLLVGVFTTLFVNIWCTRIFFDWAIARKKGTASTLSI